LEKAQKNYILEFLPTYRSLLIHYDPLKLSYDELLKELQNLVSLVDKEDRKEFRILEIPVLYGGANGPDIDFVASHNGISQKGVIQIHCSRDYLVYMLGFTPGFAYLGGMNEKIATPRLELPRINIPAGSVGIAGSQTGIYPMASPGGWQIIGRTPIKLYDPLATPPVLLRAGDYVRFIPITKEEFLRIRELVKEDRYSVNVTGSGEARIYE
ncbi:MAG: 5-oxoprolinase subunit PxpB, partial [Tissierellia bacterium]|nr:5-oxoprolinase subunit PxpB [Tissierellia bacterium]